MIKNTDIPQDDVIDENALKSVFGDDDETFKEIMVDFIDPCRSMIREIQSAFEVSSASGINQASHKLKSAALTVGAMELGAVCTILEHAGISNDWDAINAEIPKLDELMSQVKTYVASL
jgi:HPt (histidine-containing phosphotransfer) domain-containing protein